MGTTTVKLGMKALLEASLKEWGRRGIATGRSAGVPLLGCIDLRESSVEEGEAGTPPRRLGRFNLVWEGGMN